MCSILRRPARRAWCVALLWLSLLLATTTTIRAVSSTKSEQEQERGHHRRMQAASPAPTMANMSSAVPTVAPSVAPDASSTGKDDEQEEGVPSMAPSNSTRTNTTTSINPTVAPSLAPAADDSSPGQQTVSPSQEIHDKFNSPVVDKKSQAETNDTGGSGDNNNGIRIGAVFGMVIAIGAIFVIGYFVFFAGRNGEKGGRGRHANTRSRDGMREMEMSTWVNNNDNDGLL